jgi:hypothetical protein
MSMITKLNHFRGLVKSEVTAFGRVRSSEKIVEKLSSFWHLPPNFTNTKKKNKRKFAMSWGE